MTRSPMVPVLALASALALAACGGGGGGAPSGDNPPQCPPGQTGTYPDCTPAEAGGNGDADDTDGDDGAGGGSEDGDTGTATGAPGPSPTPGPTSTRPPTPTTTPTTPARGTYEALRARILAASDPAALAQTLDPETLTDNQYDALFELALVMDPETPETDRATARRIVAITDWPALDKALADGAIDLGDNPALASLHAAHRAELVVREAVRSAFLDTNTRADVPGALVPVPTPLGTDVPPDTEGLYYSVWMGPVGQIHRWDNRNADAVYTLSEIQAIAPENRTGADGATASFRGAASGFAAHIEVLEDGTTLSTAGEMTADVALTVAFGIDNTDDDRFDVAPSLTGTIDNFRLVGRTGDLGWTATIDGDLRPDGTVDPGAIATGKPPYLVRNVNDLSVAFSTDRVMGGMDSETPLKSHPPTHAAGSFDLTFTDGRAVGAFNALPRDRPRTE